LSSPPAASTAEAPTVAAAPATNAALGKAQAAASAPPPAESQSATPAVAAAQAEQSPSKQSDAVVAEVRTAKVALGDNLWDLSQHFYGWGPHYRTIYEANAAQIRNPALIYPDQIFVVPQKPTD
jgi:nucleoid-associated protein YgaU